MPHDTFRWIGVDGSEVLTHFMSTPTFGDDGGYTYNGLIDPASVKGYGIFTMIKRSIRICFWLTETETEAAE